MKDKQCKICGIINPKTKLTYNVVQGDFLCLDCYRNQFPAIPIHSTPVFL